MRLLGDGFGLNWQCVCAIAIQSEPNNYDLAHGKEEIKISIRFVGKIGFQTARPTRWPIWQAAASIGVQRQAASRPSIAVQG